MFVLSHTVTHEGTLVVYYITIYLFAIEVDVQIFGRIFIIVRLFIYVTFVPSFEGILDFNQQVGHTLNKQV